jgi:hypothetical protein
MKPFIDKLQIPALRNRLALRTFICASLAKQIETASFIAKPAITLRYEDTLKECYGLRLVLDLLERQEQEQRESSTMESAKAS